MDNKVDERVPLCPLHQRLEDDGNLTVVYGNKCIACSLHERAELLNILAPHVPIDGWVDSVGFLQLKLEKGAEAVSVLKEENGKLRDTLEAIRHIVHDAILQKADNGRLPPVANLLRTINKQVRAALSREGT